MQLLHWRLKRFQLLTAIRRMIAGAQRSGTTLMRPGLTGARKLILSDYFGRFKLSWSAPENLLYFLVEITDDAFVDGYVYPDGAAIPILT